MEVPQDDINAACGVVWVDGSYMFSPLPNGNYEIHLIDGQFRTPKDRGDCWVPPLDFKNQGIPVKHQAEHRFALAGLMEVFPDGFRIFPSNHNGIYGALRAIVASFQAQHPNVHPPKVEELQAALREHHTTRTRETAQKGTTDEQQSHLLGMLLHEWGQARGLSIDLVYIFKDKGVSRIPCPPSDRKRLVVCIYGLNLTQVRKCQWHGLAPKPELIRNRAGAPQAQEVKARPPLKFQPRKVHSNIPRPPIDTLDERSILHGPYYDEPHPTIPWARGPYWIKRDTSSGAVEKILGPGSQEPKDPSESTQVSEPKDPSESTQVSEPKDPSESTQVSEPKDPSESTQVSEPKDPSESTQVSEPEVKSSKATTKRQKGKASHFGNLSIPSPCHDSDEWKELGAIASEAPIEQEATIYISDIKLDCIRLLEDISERRIPGSEYPIYHQVIKRFSSLEMYAEQLMEFIDPKIRNLSEVWVTRALLTNVMNQQTSNYPMDIGYLNFITDDRLESYFRPYVGQTNNCRRRLLVEHATNILCGKNSTLHYFILWLGNGHRTANFVQLWSTGDCADDLYQRVSSNILEALFTRVFQSDHGATNSSDRTFGNGLGLNLLSPLLQTFCPLNNELRIRMVTPSKDSKDIQIGLWDSFRNSQKARRLPNMRPLWNEDNFRDALKVAIGNDECTENLWTAFHQSVRPNTASNAQLSRIQGDGKKIFGSLCATIGVVLDFAMTYRKISNIGAPDSNGTSLPWVLAKSGFDETNSLVWQYQFKDFQTLENMEAASFRDANTEDASKMSSWLLRSSAIKVVLVCGNRAWAFIKTLVQRDPRQVHDSITLRCGYKYPFLISQDSGKVRAQLYLKCPSLPMSDHSMSPNGGIRIGELFKFIKSLVGAELMRPFFLESQSTFRYVLRCRREEVNGAVKLSYSTLPRGLRCWISRKGFTEDDLMQLEDIAGDEGIVGGMHMLLIASSWSPTREKYNLKSGLERMNPTLVESATEHQPNKYPSEKLQRVMSLYNNIQERMEDEFAQMKASQAPTVSEDTLSSAPVVTAAVPYADGIDLHPHDLEEITQVEAASNAKDDVELGWDDDSWKDPVTNNDVLQRAAQLHDRQTNERDQRRLQRKKRCRIDNPILQRLKSVRDWSIQRQTSMLYSSTVGHYASRANRSIVICHVKLPLPADISTCEFRVQIEISNHANGHPHAYALEATQDDLGGCLAFKVMAMSGQVVHREFYATKKGIRAVAKANAFADRLIHGLDYEDMLNSTCRYVYISRFLKPLLPEKHHRFLGGGYTSDLDELLYLNDPASEDEDDSND